MVILRFSNHTSELNLIPISSESVKPYFWIGFDPNFLWEIVKQLNALVLDSTQDALVLLFDKFNFAIDIFLRFQWIYVDSVEL